MKHHNLIILSFIILFNSLFSFSYAQQEYEATLITVSPGKDIYSLFGHTALRIKSNNTSFDRVYDFGTFNPNQENFMYQFIKGTAQYSGEVHDSRHFFNYYVLTGRKMIFQQLNFSDSVIMIIKDSLDVLTWGKNKYYHYDFTKNNCTTRIRDVILNQLNNNFDTPINSNFLKELYVIRKQHGFLNSVLFEGIIVASGKYGYQKITLRDKMFLPDNLATALDTLQINNSPLVLDKKVLNEPNITTHNPVMVIFLGLGIFILLFLLTMKKTFVFNIFTGIISLFVLIILFSVFFSQRNLLVNNLNLIWMIAFVLFVLFKKKSVLIFYSLAVILLFFMVFFLIQGFYSTTLFTIWLLTLAIKYCPFKIIPKKTTTA